jgi:hypothetical protein
MSTHYVVVDGSNIATEGRSLPSLRQLDEAVKAFLTEHPADQLTVVVDATFGHRIDASERDAYEEAVLAGELVSPPAGAIGRGDAFVLQIADKVDAVILSNDSFQEFHGQYPWLFDDGRLIGGKPVPGLGWVFILRTPVRGPASRRSVKEARTASGRGGRSTEAQSPRGRRAPAKKAASGRTTAAKKGAPTSRTTAAKKRAGGPDPDPVAADGGRPARRRRDGVKPTDPLNPLLPFIDFVAAHPVGSEVAAVIESFSSHGAYAMADDVRCYIPRTSMGDPPPPRARDLFAIGDTRVFVVSSINAPRRGIDLAIADNETAVNVVSHPLPLGVPIGTVARPVERDARRKAATSAVVAATNSLADHPAEEAPVTPAKKAAAKKATARRPARKTAAKKAPARKRTAKKAPARKTAAKKAPARKRTAKKAPARKTAAKKAPARKRTAKKAPARKTAARKRTAKKAPARKTAARKAPARKRTTARKAPARKAAARRR